MISLFWVQHGVIFKRSIISICFLIEIILPIFGWPKKRQTQVSTTPKRGKIFDSNSLRFQHEAERMKRWTANWTLTLPHMPFPIDAFWFKICSLTCQRIVCSIWTISWSQKSGTPLCGPNQPSWIWEKLSWWWICSETRQICRLLIKWLSPRKSKFQTIVTSQ